VQNLARASSDLDLAAVSSQPQFQTSENSLKLAESLRSFVTIPSQEFDLKLLITPDLETPGALGGLWIEILMTGQMIYGTKDSELKFQDWRIACKKLHLDYIDRASKRLKALQTLLDIQAYADVVREAQEIVELVQKALLRASQISVPHVHDVHDVSEVIEASKDQIPKSLYPHLERMREIARDLRAQRELSFYGSEDVTPGDYFKEKDALKAFDSANWYYEIVAKALA